MRQATGESTLIAGGEGAGANFITAFAGPGVICYSSSRELAQLSGMTLGRV